MNASRPWLAPFLSLLFLAVFVGLWHLATMKTEREVVVDPEYAALIGAAAATGGQSAMPGPGDVGSKLIEHITDPVVQLVRNAVAHGIETPEERRRRGKPAQGTVTLEARHQGEFVYLEVADDGAGIDFPAIRARLEALGRGKEAESLDDDGLLGLLFSGFSSRASADEHAGRGVGLDLVRESIYESVLQHEVQHPEGVAQADQAAYTVVQSKGLLQPEGQ